MKRIKLNKVFILSIIVFILLAMSFVFSGCDNEIRESIKICYHLDGGRNDNKNPSEVFLNDIVSLNPASKSGHLFAGWYEDPYFIKSFDGSVCFDSLEENDKFCLYAKFIEQPSNELHITYELDGGKNSTLNPLVIDGTKQYISLYDASKTGYIFDGWYNDIDYQVKVVSLTSHKIKGDITLYAKFVPRNYYITYIMQGRNSIYNPLIYNIEKGVVFQDVSYLGYRTDGWYLDAKFTKPITCILPGSIGNITIYAKDYLTTFNIIYNLNEGVFSGDDIQTSFTANEIDILDNLPIPTKQNYIFECHYW